MAEAELKIKSELQRIIDQLAALQKQAEDTVGSVGKAGETTGKGVDDTARRTETAIGRMGGFMKQTMKNLKSDFGTLLNVGQAMAGLKLSNQFTNSIKQTVTLSDTVRRLGKSFGVAEGNFASFQNKLTKGMGEIGLSSEEAANVLQGLAGSGVRGEGAVTEYAKTSSQLAMISGQRGSGGAIAEQLAAVVRASGKDVNDPKNMQTFAKAVSKAVEGTGKGAAEILQNMRQSFESMTVEQRKSVTAEGLTSQAVAQVVAGPQAAAAMQKYLSMSKIERSGLEAQGFGKVFNKEGGIDIEGLKKFGSEARSRGLDVRTSLKTYGFSDQEAEGLARLLDSADQVAEALNRTAKASDDLEKKSRKSMGLSDAFQANINKIKAQVSGPLSYASQGLTDILSGASESTGGAAAVAGGGAILAAMLAGGGMRGLAGGLIGGEAKRQAREGLTGRKTQDVFVTNFDEVKGMLGGNIPGAGMGGKIGQIAGVASKGLGVLGVGAAAYGATDAFVNPLIEKHTTGKTSEGFEGNVVERLFFKLDKLLGGESSKKIMQGIDVNVQLSKGLEKTKQPSRGATVGPR